MSLLLLLSSQAAGAGPASGAGRSAYARAAIQVIVGPLDVTSRVESLTFSNVDPGGYEACTLRLSNCRGLRPGDHVQVRCGLAIAWDGRLNDPGEDYKGSTSAGQVSAVGYGAMLKNNPYRMIYVDRDLSRWRGPSLARQVALATAAVYGSPGGPEVTHDVSQGTPGLALRQTGSWLAAGVPIQEAFYESPVPINSIYFDRSFAPVDVNWDLRVGVWSDDKGDGSTVVERTTDLQSSGSPAYFTPVAQYVLAAIQLFYATGVAGGSVNADYVSFWKSLAVYGNHGLTRRGSDPGGYYPSDIATHALSQELTGSIEAGVIETSTGYVCPHSVYYTPTSPEQIIDDMAKLLGWHWGVWEPASALGGKPQLHFRSPPANPTAWLSLHNVLEPDVPKVRLDTLYDTCNVTYTDAAGSQQVSTTTQTNPMLPAGESRSIDLDMGVGSAAAAATLGQFALNLSLTGARGAGSITSPGLIDSGNGYIPSMLLKAGRDRVRVVDLPDPGPITDVDTRRFDTFRVSRVETTIDASGRVDTRIELDGGADLLEVLQARLSLANVVASD